MWNRGLVTHLMYRHNTPLGPAVVLGTKCTGMKENVHVSKSAWLLENLISSKLWRVRP